jgi:5-methylcytosine-specific restriction endonuclease McrA
MAHKLGHIPYNKGWRIRIKKSCKFCHAEFESFPSEINRIFCSNECRFASKIGIKRPQWVKEKISASKMGHEVSLELREKMRKLIVGRKPHLGIKHSMESRKKMSITHRGISSEEWSGFGTEDNKLSRNAFVRTIQKEVLKRDNYTCQLCGQVGGRLQVDHIQSWAQYVELRFNMDNCRTLCQKCHYKITYGKDIPKGKEKWGYFTGKNFIVN